jgi:hypothetical protein
VREPNKNAHSELGVTTSLESTLLFFVLFFFSVFSGGGVVANPNALSLTLL